jgi:hypothetical protein
MPLKTMRPQELPYLSYVPTGDRRIPAMPYLDAAGVWHVYLSQPDGSLVVAHPINAVASAFLSSRLKLTALHTCLPLADMIVQHFSFADAFDILGNIEHDFLNGLASIHRYFILLSYAKATPQCIPRILVNADLEFAFANHRSFYDLLNRLFMCLYKRFIIQDAKGQRVMPAHIPDSFSRLLQKSNEDLVAKFHFPQPLIAFLRGREDTFGRLCKIRDNIQHHGHSPHYVFSLSDGFALQVGEKMWSDLRVMNIWADAVLKPNGLASMLALLVFLVEDMQGAMDGLATALEQSFTQLPTAIAQGHRVYLRDHLVVHCGRLAEYREKQWFDPDAVLLQCQQAWTAESSSQAG